MYAPDFTLRDQNGNAVSLNDYRGRKVVLYFFPKAETPGCTVEACGMRDNIDLFSQRSTAVLGVSPDDVDELKSFEHNHNLNFPLLSDPTHETAEEYGVWVEKTFMGRRFMGIARTTFLIDGDGEIVKRYDNVNPVVHADTVLADLDGRPPPEIIKGTRGRAGPARKASKKGKTAKRAAPAARKPATKSAKKTKKRPAAKSTAKSAKKSAKNARKTAASSKTNRRPRAAKQPKRRTTRSTTKTKTTKRR